MEAKSESIISVYYDRDSLWGILVANSLCPGLSCLGWHVFFNNGGYFDLRGRAPRKEEA